MPLMRRILHTSVESGAHEGLARQIDAPEYESDMTRSQWLWHAGIERGIPPSSRRKDVFIRG